MFSGIIEHQAKIISKTGGLFHVENTFSEPVHIGQSIAHDGACMTLTSVSDTSYEFFVMEESLRLTNLGTKEVGAPLNVERCISLGDRLDGHIVSGHIDTVGTLSSIDRREDGSMYIFIEFDPVWTGLIIRKGSIALNGTSLTIVDALQDRFSVSLIPLTQQWTNLGSAKIGDQINIEFDMIGKYIERLTRKS